MSNLYQIPSQIHLAKLLVDHSFGDRAFFCNSGTEANEAAIKLARKYAKETRATDVVDIITMRGAFHGRTLGALSATPTEKYQHFEPSCRVQVRAFGDVKAASTSTTARRRSSSSRSRVRRGQRRAGGLPSGAPPAVRRRRRPPMFDEIQTGMGRTGCLWGYQHWGVEPDVMTLAKALASGIPIGAMVAREACAKVLIAGTHGTTFGGNLFATTVGVATFTTMLEDRLPERADRVGTHLIGRLRALAGDGVPARSAVAGLPSASSWTAWRAPSTTCRDRGLLILTAGEKILRMTPPLIVDEATRIARWRSWGMPSGRPSREAPALDRDLSARRRGPLPPRRRVEGGPKARDARTPLAGHSLALVFEKPSLRTRVTFEVGMAQPGPVYLAGGGTSDSTRESIPDVARNLGRWVDAISARTFAQATVDELARHAGPVVNALSDQEHPCQALADLHAVEQPGPPAPASGLDRGRQQRLPLAHPAGQSSRHGDGRGRAAGVRAGARVLETARRGAGASP